MAFLLKFPYLKHIYLIISDCSSMLIVALFHLFLHLLTLPHGDFLVRFAIY